MDEPQPTTPTPEQRAAALLAAEGPRINALVQSCFQYNRDLRTSAAALDATARSYGYSDDEIAASFRPTS